MTSETLGSRRRFRRLLIMWLAAVLGICLFLIVLFATGSDVLTHIAAALVGHAGASTR